MCPLKAIIGLLSSKTFLNVLESHTQFFYKKNCGSIPLRVAKKYDFLALLSVDFKSLWYSHKLENIFIYFSVILKRKVEYLSVQFLIRLVQNLTLRNDCNLIPLAHGTQQVVLSKRSLDYHQVVEFTLSCNVSFTQNFLFGKDFTLLTFFTNAKLQICCFFPQKLWKF